MTLVVDACLVVASLVDGGPQGEWAEKLLATDELAAPQLMLVEAANTLRRLALAGEIPAEVSSGAYMDLLALDIELMAYRPVAARVWQLRETVTAYDAWYVALAETLDSPLATIALPLTRAPGPRCRFLTPPP